MNISRNIKTNFKRTIRQNADRFLSPEVKEELGFSKSVNANDVDNDFNAFWSPVQSNLLNTSNKSEKLSGWVIGVVVVLSVLLLISVYSLIAPSSKSYSTNEGNIVVVDGTEKVVPEEKIEETEVEEDKSVEEMTSEEIKVENIVVSSEDISEVASKSPLLTSGTASVMEYKVKNGDTLERICVKFYGEYNYDLINKIKVANNIRNARYLRVGQKLIIPYN